MYMAKMMVENDPTLMERAGKIADECGVIGGPRCEQALEFTKCLKHQINLAKVDFQLV